MTNQELAAIEELLSAASGETRSFAMVGALSAAARLLAEVRRLKGYEQIVLKSLTAVRGSRCSRQPARSSAAYRVSSPSPVSHERMCASLVLDARASGAK